MVSNGASKHYDQEDGELYVTGRTPDQINTNMKDLQTLASGQVDVIGPYPIHVETVTSTMNSSVQSKSPNKQNIISVSVQPLEQSIVGLIDGADEATKAALLDPTKRAQYINESLGIHDDWTKNILAFGPGEFGPNVLVNNIQETQNVEKVLASLNAGFQLAVNQGPLMEQPLRGCRFNLTNLVISEDPKKGSRAQIIPMMRRIIYGAFLSSLSPGFSEPMLKVTLEESEGASDSESGFNSLLRFLEANRAKTLDGSPIQDMAFSKTAQFFVPGGRLLSGFEADLHENSSRTAKVARIEPSHYGIVPGDLRESFSHAGSIAREVRIRKGLREFEGTSPDNYLDK